MNSKRLKKRDVVDRLVMFLNLIALAALSATYIAGSIVPNALWPLGFVAMAYPVTLVFTLLFIVYWLFRRKWFLFLNISFLVLKWDYVQATVKFNLDDSEAKEGIKVMTYNVRLFDHYNWSNDQSTSFKAQEFIFGQRSDIICIQEFYNRKGEKFRAMDTLLSSNRVKHFHSENYKSKLKSNDFWGLATLSAYPIINKGQIPFYNSESALAIFTDVVIESDTVRIYNVHLQSIHLGNEGYAVLDEIIATQDLEDVNRGKIVLRRMKSGFQKRAEQAEILATHIEQCPFAVILCGDFNDVPTSYTYQTIVSAGLQDAFSKAGTGFGATYVRVPFFRIDNILYSKEFVANRHTVHPYAMSDHLAVTANLKQKD